MVEINECYKPLYTSPKRYFLVTGGRGSLKSTSVHDFIQRLTYEKGHGVLFTRYTMTSAEKSIIPEFRIVSERNGSIKDFVFSGNTVTNKITGSFIIFSGIKTSSGDHTANLKSLAGITTWVIDEGEDFNNEKTFDDIDDSIRIKGVQNRVIWVQNPSTKEHFIYKRWIEPKPRSIEVEGYQVTVSGHEDVEHIHTTYHIAKKFLNQSFLLKAEKQQIENPSRYYHKYIGGWLDKAEGVVYEDFKLGKFPEDLDFQFGLDFGSNDPDALTKVAVNHKNKTIYIKQEYLKNDTSVDDLFNVLVDRCGYYHRIIADSAERRLIRGYYHRIIADSAERRLIRDYYSRGLNILKADKRLPKATQIKHIKGWNLVVDEDSPDLIKAFKNYKWHDKKAGTVDHDYSDLMDSWRYSVIDLLGIR